VDLVILIAAIAVVLVASAGLVVARTRKRVWRRPQAGPGADVRPGEAGADLAEPGAAPAPPVATVELPDVIAAPPAEPPAPEAAAPPAPEADAAADVAAAEAALAPPLEVPAPAAGRLVRLRARLARSQSTLGRGLLTLLSGSSLDAETWEDVEATLLASDVGVGATAELVESLRTKTQVLGARTPAQVRALLRDELLAQVGTAADRSLRIAAAGRPAVLLVVGVNGTGKTTTCGKIARLLAADGKSVVLGAADTFRAAAADQLETWGNRVGATTVRGPEGGDPASVAFDAVRRGVADAVDAVVVDTAGRLHTKAGLMDELGKVKRVVGKQSGIDEVLLVLDATTGQNAVEQARVFTRVVDVTGIVLTKLDGTAKGGVVIAVQRELGVPVKLVGLGEGPDDLAPFEPEAFVDAVLGDAGLAG
jgi:fused signal recognition particle receptor